MPDTAYAPPAVPKLDLRGAGLTKHSTQPLPPHVFAATRDKYIYEWLHDSCRDDSCSETCGSSTCFTDCPGNWASARGTIARLSPTSCQSYLTAQHHPPLINAQVCLSRRLDPLSGMSVLGTLLISFAWRHLHADRVQPLKQKHMCPFESSGFQILGVSQVTEGSHIVYVTPTNGFCLQDGSRGTETGYLNLTGLLPLHWKTMPAARLDHVELVQLFTSTTDYAGDLEGWNVRMPTHSTLLGLHCSALGNSCTRLHFHTV